jgi:hypothetical protein
MSGPLFGVGPFSFLVALASVSQRQLTSPLRAPPFSQPHSGKILEVHMQTVQTPRGANTLLSGFRNEAELTELLGLVGAARTRLA